MRTLSLLFFIGILFVSCNNSNTSTTTETDTTEAPETPAAKKYTLTPFSNSPEFADAKIESMDYANGTFKFGVGGESYTLGEQTADAGTKMCANSAKGQHIHLIVNNGPYAAKYVDEFEHDVEDGDHYLLAFLSRSYHESIKNGTAFTAKKVSVKDKSITYGEDVSGPMLFYSRPKGTYAGKANTDKVMLDFYLANVELGEAYSIKAEINGEEHSISTWQPYYIEGLPMGKNTVKLTLLDADGFVAKVPLNPVTREFTLAADPAEN